MTTRRQHGPRCATAKRHDAGFSVLEVLVALAIFAMAAVVLASTYLNILNGYEVLARSGQMNADLAFARSIVLNETDRTKLEQGGQFDNAAGNRVNWSVEITSTSMPELFTVTFTCEIGEGSNQAPEKTTQTFTLLRPSWVVDTAERDELREQVKQRIAELQGQQPT